MEFDTYRKKRVFISSKCGGMYRYVRRELQILLEKTGLFEVYNFDEEGSSASDVDTHYLGQLSSSDIVIFLIDNKDGVTDPVFKEHTRAKEVGLKRHYLFCDEENRTSTTLQAEIMQDAKYEVVHEFSKMGEHAYTSILQDIIDSYCRKELPASNANSTSVMTEVGNSISKNNDLNAFTTINKVCLEAPNSIKKYIWDILIGNKTEPLKKEDSVEYSLYSFLNTVLCLKPFDTDTYQKLSVYLLQLHDDNLKEIIRLRLHTIRQYYEGRIDNAVEEERNALKAALNSKDIPSWLINDIAIDLRNLIIDSERSKGNFLTAGGEGQKILDESKEPVYFPLLDRKISEANKKILKRYEKHYSDSPFSVTIGDSLEPALNDYLDAFWIALIYGSNTHVCLFVRNLVDYLKMIINIYDDHIPAVQLIRFTCIDGNNLDANLDYIESTYHSDSELLNPGECESILESIKMFPLGFQRRNVLYKYFVKFSMYLKENDFEDICDEMITDSIGWLNDESRIRSLFTNIANFYYTISQREHINDSLDFGIALLEKTGQLYLNDLAQKYRSMDYSNADSVKLKKFTSLLLQGLDEGKKFIDDHSYVKDLLVRIELSNEECASLIGSALKEKVPEYFDDIYQIEMDLIKLDHGNKSVEIFPFIEEYLQKIKKENLAVQQGIGITGYDNYQIILNVLRNWHPLLNETQVNQIITTIFSVFANKGQSIRNKSKSCEIISLLSRQYGELFDKKKVYQQLLDNRSDYMNCADAFFSNDTLTLLEYAYNLMLLTFSTRDTGKIQELLFSVRQDQSYTLIQLLAITKEFLEADKDQLISEMLLTSFLQFTLVTSQNIDKNVQVQCVLVLVELSKYKKTMNAAIRRLSKFMSSGNAYMRMVTIARVNDINGNNEYVKAIKQKALNDHNYVVRKLAMKAVA